MSSHHPKQHHFSPQSWTWFTSKDIVYLMKERGCLRCGLDLMGFRIQISMHVGEFDCLMECPAFSRAPSVHQWNESITLCCVCPGINVQIAIDLLCSWWILLVISTTQLYTHSNYFSLRPEINARGRSILQTQDVVSSFQSGHVALEHSTNTN